MIKTIKCDYCHGQNAIRLSFPGEYTWYDVATIDSSTGLSDQHEVYVCKDCGKVMLKKVGETLEIVEKILDADGVPIKVGDIVYGVSTNVGDVSYVSLGKGKAYTVERIEANGENSLVDIAEAKDRWRLYSVSPENLTHECFDSWEQFEEDVYHLITKGYLDTPDRDVKDIVRRAKALAKVKKETRR